MKRIIVVLLAGGLLFVPATAQALRWNGVKVGPVAAKPKTTHPGGRASIRFAPTRAPAGFVYDVQKKQKGKQWKMYRRGVRTRNVKFRPKAPGRTASVPGSVSRRADWRADTRDPERCE